MSTFRYLALGVLSLSACYPVVDDTAPDLADEPVTAPAKSRTQVSGDASSAPENLEISPLVVFSKVDINHRESYLLMDRGSRHGVAEGQTLILVRALGNEVTKAEPLTVLGQVHFKGVVGDSILALPIGAITSEELRSYEWVLVYDHESGKQIYRKPSAYSYTASSDVYYILGHAGKSYALGYGRLHGARSGERVYAITTKMIVVPLRLSKVFDYYSLATPPSGFDLSALRRGDATITPHTESRRPTELPHPVYPGDLEKK